MICFGVVLAATVVLGAALVNRISVIHAIRDGDVGAVFGRASDADDFVNGSAGFFAIAELIVGVLFIVWIFRTAKNNEALGRDAPRFGPGWSIGAWFIPLANLVIPVLIAQDLWRGSDAATPRAAGDWRRASGSWLVASWWLFWVLSFVRYFAGGTRVENGSLDDIERSNVVALVGVGLTAVAAVLAVCVVRALTRRQLETLRVQRLAYEHDVGLIGGPPAVGRPG